MINFTKNIAMIGALLMLSLLQRPWPMSPRLFRWHLPVTRWSFCQVWAPKR